MEWSEHSWVRSCAWLVVFALVAIGGASARELTLTRGPMSPFQGKSPSDLVRVILHISPINWQMSGAFFDNGSIVISNTPLKGKKQTPCDESAAYCVCAPAMWFFKGGLGGPKQIREGNEVASVNNMMFNVESSWQRLPGQLIVRLYVVGYPLSGISSGSVASDPIDTKAGETYEFDVVPEQVAGGLTVKIRPRAHITDVDKDAKDNVAGQEDSIAIAAGKGDLARVQALIAAQADVNAKAANGATGLMLASTNGHADVVKALLEDHADPNMKWINGSTALILASEVGHADVVRALLNAAADVDIKNIKGANALMSASGKDHLEIVKLLLDAKAEVNAQAANGVTALMLASDGGNLDVVQALLDAKADLSVRMKDGSTALKLASRNHHKDVEQLLRSAGARK